jgi:hypothetical protein
MSTHGFKFLAEKPLQTAEEISQSKFGHEEIADTLVKIVKGCPTPFTVGLFAKWGSGKSTVANSLKDKLPKENIPVIIFDVWKHEGDSLRRTFLKEMVRQLKEAGSTYFDMSFAVNDRIEQSVSRSAESKIKFQTEAFKQLGPYIIAILFLVAVGGYVADYFNKFDLFLQFIVSITGFTSGGALLLWLVKNSVNLFSKETVSYGADKFSDPHEFEEEFGRVLRALKNPRVLIIFDNLDRVMHDKVAEVLSTVKTFLEPQDIADEKKEVVFLVPCDAKAIKQHLSSLYNPAEKEGINHAFDPDEFLRKFFNTIIWIPDFIPSELEAFARSRLKETGVPLLDNDYVAWIITKAFRNNPRQIIQFTNILLANYLLVEEREGDDKDFPTGFLSENVPQLTKYLVLNQLFPDEMDILREKKVLDLNEVEAGDLSTKTKTLFLAFVEETKNIPITDLRTFFTLRRSEQEKKFPGFETFIAHLEDRSTEDATKYFEQVGDLSNPDIVGDFSQALKEELGSKANPVSTVNLIHTLLEVLDDKKATLTSTFYEEVNNILGNGCKGELHTIDPDVLNNAFLVKDDKYRKNIVPQWLVVMEDVLADGKKYKADREFVKAIVSIFAAQPSYLQPAQVTKVKELLSSHLSNDLDVAKIITQSPEAQTTLGNADYVRNFATAIPNSGAIDDVASRMEVLNAFQDKLLTAAGGDTLVKKFNDLLNGENQNTKPEAYPAKAKLLDQFREFMRSHRAVFSAAPVATRDTFVDFMNVGFNAPSDHQVRAVFVPALYELRPLISDAKRDETERFISSWLTNVQPDTFTSTFESLTEDDQVSFFEVQSLYEHGSNRSLADQAFRTIFFPLLSEARMNQFIEKILNHDFDKAFEFFESLNSKDVKQVFINFDKSWAKFDASAPAQKQRLFKFVNKHKANNEVAIREVLANKIITCLTIADTGLQQIGLEAFEESTLAKDLRRKIVKEAFDWVKKPEISPKYQAHVIRAIVAGYEEFNQEEKNEFTQFVFDEIVRKSVKQAHLVGAFEVLRSLSPKYEERQTNFDDIKTRIESEENADLKKVLIEGIDSLRPAKTNKNNEEYWNWIQQEKEKLNPAT